MWYFSWVLGLGLACAFAILNAMWFEMKEDRRLSALAIEPEGRPGTAERGGQA